MMYVVHYFDDDHRQHMAFVKSLRDIEFLRERFGEVTVESYSVDK